MPECIVLSDTESHETLVSLTRDNIIAFREMVSKALIDFSATDERLYQPDPAVVTRADGQKTLFRPFTSTDSVGIKIIVDRVSASEKAETRSGSGNGLAKKPALHGILAVCDEDGLPKGFINADEVTAYRTSMSVMIPYSWRRNTANVVVFGAGNTALWHIRLALGLRGEDIKSISIVNRSVQRARTMIDQVRQENGKFWKSTTTFHILDQSNPRYQQNIREVIADANVVFCTTPSSSPLFPVQYVNQDTCFISGIGSWQPDMAEIDPDLLIAAGKSGKVVVDDRGGAMGSSGEIIQSKLKADQITELGELLHKRDNAPGVFQKERESYLEDGLVVYKSVGVSLTDLAAANALLALAKRHGKGLSVLDF